jgi:hypothetical protein
MMTERGKDNIMTPQQHMDAYRADIKNLNTMMQNALNSADPAAALVEIAKATHEMSVSATQHLDAVKGDEDAKVDRGNDYTAPCN